MGACTGTSDKYTTIYLLATYIYIYIYIERERERERERLQAHFKDVMGENIYN